MTMTILLNLDREIFLQIHLAINAKFKLFKSIAPGIPSSKKRKKQKQKQQQQQQQQQQQEN